MKENYYIVAFNSTHHAISTEQMLKDQNKEVMTIPTPREITASCGLSLRIMKEDVPYIKEQLKEKNMSYYGIFRVQLGGEGKKVIEKIEG